MTRRRGDPPPEGTRGRLLFDARINKGLSQAALAKLIGTSPRNIVRWEQNENRPGLDFSEALAEELGLPLDKVLDPAVAHIRRSQDHRVNRLLGEMAQLRQQLDDCRRENRELRRELLRAAV